MRSARQALVVVALLAWTAPPVHAAPAAPVPAAVRAPGIGFRSRARLDEHFSKHGREFGARSPGEYLALAQRLRDCPADDGVLEGLRPDGVTVRYDRATGAFLAFEGDRTIRTFFKPRRGEEYFRRQMERGR